MSCTDYIEIKDLSVFGNHGVMPEENVVGQKFLVGVKLYFDDNSSWVLVRPSGTEPLLRIYFESDSVEKLEKLRNLL